MVFPDQRLAQPSGGQHEVGDIGWTGGDDLCHPSGVDRIFSRSEPGVSAFRPRPPANGYDPYGIDLPTLQDRMRPGQSLQRFLRETQAAARLTHTNIVTA